LLLVCPTKLHVCVREQFVFMLPLTDIVTRVLPSPLSIAYRCAVSSCNILKL
jgi:hypothetical protein